MDKKLTREEIVTLFGRDRMLAHQALFRHRHPDATPPFHEEMIRLWHSNLPRVSIMAMREGGKSTVAEEAFVLGADMQLFRNAIIVGSTEKRAVERLRAVKHELDTNELNEQLFGPLGEQGATVWNDAEVILANGVRIFAVGRGQSLRGTKHLHWRPDFCFCDDIEEVEPGQLYSEHEAHETVRWFMKVLIPALDKDARVRVIATPLSKEALPVILANDPSWVHKVYPIETIDEHGERKPTWPARYPLEWIDAKKASFERLGLHHDYMQEYMCETEDPAKKVFTSSMLQIKPRIRTWEPTFAFYDPARTVKTTSATTGWACWSWISNRLIVWDGGAELWRPDELIEHIFKLDDEYGCVEIGIEETGLHEFVMQPLRQEMVRRGYYVPVVPYNAPKGKLQFIEALQPFFNAGEISFAKDIQAKAQFLSYPGGKIDFPNALAYALKMRPGQAIYDGFSGENVVDTIPLRMRESAILALNSLGGVTTGVLVQFVNGALHVIADWIIEGDAGSVVSDIVKAAQLMGPQALGLVGPRVHFGPYDRVGLRGAVAKLPARLQSGGAENVGRDELRTLLQRQIRGRPACLVSQVAHWTVNAFSSGYVRSITKAGLLSEEAKPGPYRVLMEGLESVAALMRSGIGEDDNPAYSYTKEGRRFVSALPGQAPQSSKSDWLTSG
jgi:hypothetical protein